MQKSLSLGAECLEIQKTGDVSKGTYLCFLGFSIVLLYCAFDSSFCVVILSIVSLANALVCVASLEPKLKTTSKALKEADEKRAKEVSAANVSTDKEVKAAEARAIKAEKALAKVSQTQAKHEEDVVK
jgi:hypothetical protein